MRPQARAARFYNKFSSYKNFLPPATGILGGGWARPIYINRHPQPPAKYIRFSEICQDNYFTYPQQYSLTGGLGHYRMNLSMTILIDKILA